MRGEAVTFMFLYIIMYFVCLCFRNRGKVVKLAFYVQDLSRTQED